MKVKHSFCSLILLTVMSRIAGGNPVGALPGASRALQPNLKTLVTTVTDQGSAYTLTYVPSTVSAATTLVEGTSTTSYEAGAVVGALAGGAAVVALPLAIPKALPEPVLEANSQEGGDSSGEDQPGCEQKSAKACTENCSADCVVDATNTNSYAISTPSVVTLTTSSPHNGPATATPLDPLVIQAYLGKEYLRLHIDGNGGNANPNAKCQKDPAKGTLLVDGVKASITDFCKSNNGIGASPNSGLLNTYNQDENRMQVVLQVSYVGSRGQGAIYTVDEKKCNDLFGKILPCGSDKDHTSGGNLTSEKGVYSIEPYLYPGKLECAPNGGKYGVVRDEALANIDDFCSKFDGQKINQGEKKDNKYFQKGGGLLSTISVAWETNSIGCEQGGRYDHGYLINKVGQTINECNQDKTDFKAAGIITDQCARYQLSVESRESVICGTDPRYFEAERALWVPFDLNAAYEAIDVFCGQDLLADPAVVDRTGGFSQYGDWPKGIAKGGKRPVYIDVTFHSHDDLGGLCGLDTPTNQAFKTGGDQCRKKMRKVVDGCDTSEGAQKKGGWLVDSVSLVSAMSKDPLLGFPTSMQRPFQPPYIRYPNLAKVGGHLESQ
ncbi:MAG: hypothetical protein Q9209_005445 [Squamulea sp. 1 TL-2023]